MIHLAWVFFANFTSAIGVFWLILKVFEFFFPWALPWLNWNWTFIVIVLTSIIYAVFRIWPWRAIRLPVAGTDAYISVKFGNILDSDGNIAIASSNFFNTDLDIVAKGSLLGQYILKHFSGSTSKIEEGISRSLSHVKSEDIAVSRGKTKSFPIGTVAMFDGPGNNKVFLLAITEIREEHSQERTSSSVSNIQKTLDALWDQAEHNINDGTLSMVPLGSGISHGFNRVMESVISIALSFVKRCKTRRPCLELTIFVRKTDIKLQDYGDLKQVLKAIAG